VSLTMQEFGMASAQSYQVQDLLTEAQYTWRGSRNFVQLNPSILPAHIFHVRPIG
jgi:starch synthase (maltosyl-transferring)